MMLDKKKEKKFSLVKAYEYAPDIRPAEKGACGTLPAAALQYCEAVRIASSYGWYVYCPVETSLYFDGREVYFYEDNRWNTLKSHNLPDDFRQTWSSVVPDHLKGLDPPFLTQLFVPGMVQIWSGYLLKSAPDWSVNIRSIVNADTRSSISFYEGIVETSMQEYMPLFINFRILKTDIEIYLPPDRPLFQIQPIHKECYSSGQKDIEIFEMCHLNEEEELWNQYAQTIRKKEDQVTNRPGRYATAVRKQMATQ